MNWTKFLEDITQFFFLTSGSEKGNKIPQAVGYYASENVDVTFASPDGNTNGETLNAFSDENAQLSTRGYRDVTVFLGGNGSSQIHLAGIHSALVRTQEGDDYIQLEVGEGIKGKPSVHVYANAGNDTVILTSHMVLDASYRIVAGSGNDQLISRGRSKDFLNGGEGDDYFEPGFGSDVIIGGPGFDEVVLDRKMSDYSITDLGNRHFEVRSVDADGTGYDIKTVVDIEKLTFLDGVFEYIDPSLTLNDAQVAFSSWTEFSFLNSYQSAVNSQNDAYQYWVDFSWNRSDSSPTR